MSMFFDPRRYDLAKVGRYKFNKKLALRSRIRNQILSEDVVDPSTGEILAEKAPPLHWNWQTRFRTQQYRMYGSRQRRET